MSSEAGTLAYVKVKNNDAGNFCLFGLVLGNGSIDHRFLWFDTTTAQPTAADWILRNAQVALLRDGFVNKLPIVIFTDDANQITSVQLGAMAPGEPQQI